MKTVRKPINKRDDFETFLTRIWAGEYNNNLEQFKVDVAGHYNGGYGSGFAGKLKLLGEIINENVSLPDFPYFPLPSNTRASGKKYHQQLEESLGDFCKALSTSPEKCFAARLDDAWAVYLTDKTGRGSSLSKRGRILAKGPKAKMEQLVKLLNDHDIELGEV